MAHDALLRASSLRARPSARGFFSELIRISLLAQMVAALDLVSAHHLFVFGHASDARQKECIAPLSRLAFPVLVRRDLVIRLAEEIHRGSSARTD